MDNFEQRIDRQLATMKAAEKRKLLDTHIGPVMPGHKPDPEDDEIYLRGIVGGMLRDHDAQVEAATSSGVAKLETPRQARTLDARTNAGRNRRACRGLR
jgi:hypothetical protein